ncbi:MAG: DNA-3-methyladenine glycosylase family protein [Opitutaceae bacterium]
MWSPWQPLGMADRLRPEVLGEILGGGQAFRWQRRADGSWAGAWSSFAARLRVASNGDLEWSAPAARAAATGPALRRYVDADRPARAAADLLPWRSDPHLERAIAAFPGLRLLRQPFGETLLCFLCSAAKRIAQIKQMAGLLAECLGEPLLADAGVLAHAPFLGRKLPDWTALARAPESRLRACKLGFRARHVHCTAQFLAAHPGWLDETEALPYGRAKERLLGLPGVGEKVADCVLLFGAGQLEAFPVDVWILSTMARRYGLERWRPAQVAQFGRIHFGPQAGLAQQYLFAWERTLGSTSEPAIS